MKEEMNELIKNELIKFEKEKKNKKDLDCYWIWFLSLDISNIKKIELLSEYKTVENMYFKYTYNSKYNENINLELMSNERKEKAIIYSKYIKRYNIKLIKYTDKIYPKNLLNIPDYPIALFAIGNIKLLSKKCIAIVGARDSSKYAENITGEISNFLSKKNYTIVSGLARGIDRKAHISTIKYNTIAVLGSGITKKTFYPKENYELFLNIIKNGGLVLTENMPDSKPYKWKFPMRNRIIAGISDSIIVTEAKKKSGSLITARFGLEFGKDVYTIPGNIDSDKYSGNNLLILDGAIPITEIADLDIYF